MTLQGLGVSTTFAISSSYVHVCPIGVEDISRTASCSFMLMLSTSISAPTFSLQVSSIEVSRSIGHAHDTFICYGPPNGRNTQ